MNKALLISIQSRHLVNILNGKKTLELRKSVPKGFVGWVYFYCTLAKPYLIEHIVPKGKYGKRKIYKLENKKVIFANDHTYLNGKVVARFWFDKWFHIFDLNKGKDKFTYGYSQNKYLFNVDYLLDDLRLTEKEIYAYGKGKTLYAWEIDKLEIFDKPKELSDFYKRIDGLDESGGFILTEEEVTIPQLRKKYLLQRAPQSFQYVWVKE